MSLTPGRTGRLFNYDGAFLLPVDDAVVRVAVAQTMAPFGYKMRWATPGNMIRSPSQNSP